MKKSNGKENPLEIIKTPPGNFCNKSIGHLNERQIEVVREIISENNYPKNDIGIMAPYRTQVEAIKDIIGEEYEVATVHKFQGKEKKQCTILFFSSLHISDTIGNRYFTGSTTKRSIHERV